MSKANNSPANPRIKPAGKKTKARVSLTYAEIDITLQTMGQMEDGMEYYNFIPQPYRGKLLEAYGTVREKLEAAKQTLHRPAIASREYKHKFNFNPKNQE